MIPTYALNLRVNFCFLKSTKISAEFHLYLEHPKLLTTINILNQCIIT